MWSVASLVTPYFENNSQKMEKVDTHIMSITVTFLLCENESVLELCIALVRGSRNFLLLRLGGGPKGKRIP